MIFSEKTFVRILFFIHLLLSCYYLDIWRNPNTTSRMLQVRSLYENGKLSIDPYQDQSIDIAEVNGKFYADKAPLPAFLVLGVYHITTGLGITSEPQEDNGDSILIIGSLISSIAFTLIILLIYKKLRRLEFRRWEAILLSSVPLYASLAFVYAGTFYSHLLVSWLILQSFILIQKDEKYWLSGILCGAAFMSEYVLLVVAFAWSLQFLIYKKWNGLMWFGFGFLPFALIFLLHNYAITGNPFKTLYSYHVYYDMSNSGFTWPQLDAIWHMLFSPYKGAFIYMPVLISLVYFTLKNRGSFRFFDLSNHLILPVLFLFFTVSCYREWAGGWTFGPRYILPILVLIVYAGVRWIKLDKMQQLWFWIPVLIGCIHAFLTKLTVLYSIPSKFPYPFFQLVLPKWNDGVFNDGNFLTRYFETSPGNSAMIYLIFFILSYVLMYFLARSE